VAARAFMSTPQTLRAQTVHDLKGQSRDAVLVVADRLRSRTRGAQGALWSRPILGEGVPPEDAEELRIVFVALTRAQRYCALALPADTETAVMEGFQAAGFVLAPTASALAASGVSPAARRREEEQAPDATGGNALNDARGKAWERNPSRGGFSLTRVDPLDGTTRRLIDRPESLLCCGIPAGEAEAEGFEPSADRKARNGVRDQGWS
jgi:hypothetical protein